MPYDTASLATIAVSAALLALAWRLQGSIAVRLALILAAATIIRCDAAYQLSLHEWDERYHALVARNLAVDPLKPTLYRAPALPYDHRDWTGNHVWLHKPPGALWLMAGSMRLFGTGELALRAPGVILSVLSVMLTFSIARRLFSEQVALLAAGIHAVNGFLVALAAGRRVADHVDTALVFFVMLGIWAAIRMAALPGAGSAALAGAALGAGFLVKSFPALLVFPVALAVWVMALPARQAAGRLTQMMAAALLVALPWTLFAWARYPAEASWSAQYTMRHMTQVLEGQGTHWWTYFSDLPRFFGELAVLSIPVAILAALQGGATAHALRPLLVWAGVPYLLFSIFATRLPGYVMTAAPAIFIMEAWAWTVLWRRSAHWPDARRFAGRIVLAVLLLTPARYLLEPSGVFEKRDRSPVSAERLRRLENVIGRREAVLFNAPQPIEAMFYSPYTAYERMPNDDEVRSLSARHLTIVVYERRGERVRVPEHWPVVILREEDLEAGR